MRTHLLALALLATIAQAEAGAAETFTIVSDVDDTVKITNVRSKHRAALNAVKSELVFAGMSDLYAQMLGPSSGRERLRFISGSSRVLDGEIGEALQEAQFPAYDVTLRRIRDTFVSPFTFKTRELTALYGQAREPFILIGDDTEADPKVYAAFAKAKPGQVLAIYIRRVTAEPLPDGMIPFVTAYDIAMSEFGEGRLTREQADIVGNAVFASPTRTLLPRFQQCPQPGPSVASCDSIQERIQARLREICNDRGH